MAISNESPPNDIDDRLFDYLSRRFKDVSIEFEKASSFPERKEMPYKPRVGDIHYFGVIGDHNYDPIITAEGWWGFKSTGWVLIV